MKPATLLAAALAMVPALSRAQVSITTTTLPSGTAGSAYSAPVAATGGQTPYTWSASGLPPGLNIDPQAGQISGTPTAAGSYSVTVQVTDATPSTATQALTIGIAIGIGGSLGSGSVGVAYSASLSATGGQAPYSWSATGLPAGLAIDPQTGAVSGIPLVPGQSTVGVNVSDAAGNSGSRSFTVSVTVPVVPLAITTSGLPGGTVNAPYSATLAARGGVTPYTWSSSPLPSGLALDSASGAITGTPTATGSSSVSVVVTDSTNATATGSFVIAIGPAPSITTSSLPNGAVGVAYSATLAGSGGTTPYTWTATGLPPGISLSSSGALSGTPTASGSYTVAVTLKDANNVTASNSFAVTIAPALTITTTSLRSGTSGVLYLQAVTASGGTTPYTWSATGLPSGMTMGSASGNLSGTPASPGTFTVAVTVTDASQNTASKSFSLTIAAGLTISTSTLPNGIAGVAYSASVSASGGASPYTWSATGLPPGISLSTSGSFSGTPTTAGPYTVAVQVTDGNNTTVSHSYNVTIGAALAISTTSLPNGVAGVAYSATVAASGGTSPYSFSATGLPAGLTLSSSSGALSGTPTTAGTASVTVQVTDANNSTVSKTLGLSIGAALAISTASLATPTVGAAYSATIAATGGTTPYSFSATGLPAGLTLNASTGAISGTPTTAGAVSITVQVKDANNTTVSKSYAVTVAPALVLSTASLPVGTVGAAYSATLAASGGTPPYSFSATGLPAGITLNASTGALSGTPTAAGTSNVSLQVKDANNVTVSKSLSLAVAPPLVISTQSLAAGTASAAYAATIAATGGAPPYTWAVASGSLPSGLSLGASTGQIAGTPSAAGTASFTIQVSDSAARTATANLSITVNPPLALSGTLPGGTVGIAYAGGLSVAGGTAPVAWSVTSGALPPGLALNASSGSIGGTPTQDGSFSFTIRVNDAAGASATQAATVTIVPALSVATTSLPDGAIGISYSGRLAAAGGSPPYTWSVQSGSLPQGLSLDAQSGAISGTPSGARTSPFTVLVRDSAGTTATKDLSITINSNLTITSTSPLAAAVVGTAYSQALAAISGAPPYQWSVSAGALSAGLTLDAATGVISGTPTTTGTASFTITVTDAAQRSISKPFTLTVVGGLTVTTASLPGASLGASYSQALQAVGGTSPYTWAIDSGALPPGLSLNASTGVISGKPSSRGSYDFTVRVTDSVQATATRALTLAVGSSLAITTGSTLKPGQFGVAYSVTLAAAGGSAPYTWAITSGSLPDGLTLDASSGTISGTPDSAGTFTFTVRVTDSAKATASANMSLVIAVEGVPAVTITGVGDTANPLEQPTIGVTIAQPYSKTVDGQLLLTFTPDAAAGGDDPAIQFSTGGRTADFTIPVNATTAVFSVPKLQIQTGSVAGTIAITAKLKVGGADATGDPPPSHQITIPRAAPVIRSVKLVRTSTGFEVWVTGYSSPREITGAAFQFTAAPGSDLQTTSVTVPMTDAARQWYQDSASTNYGSQFTIVQPFTINGNSNAVSSVSVTLTNSAGTSQAQSASF